MASVFSETDPIADAEALIASGEERAAVEQLRARLSAGRGGLLARMTMVKALLAQGALPAAIAELQRAQRLDPALDRARLLTGQAWLEAGEAAKALEVFE